jgi:hypothetical protein
MRKSRHLLRLARSLTPTQMRRPVLCLMPRVMPTLLPSHVPCHLLRMPPTDFRRSSAGMSGGLSAACPAVEDAFGADIDYAMLQKIYGVEQQLGEVRYSPAQCMGARRAVISGTPDFKHVSTSMVERQNLTMRMSMRRFTRLTNAFSKKVENHEHSVAIHYINYNFSRIHQTLRVTPAMEAGITDHVWELEEIVGLLP